MNLNQSKKIRPADSAKLSNERIYERVFEAIVDHKLLPGTHLKEDELCDVFEVGRTRMRAILSKLAADHIVEQVANRGVFVARPSIEDAREVFRARRLVEGHLIRRATEKPTPALREALSNHLHHEQAARDSDNQGAVIKLCGKYHQVLANQADSPIMARFARELIARSSLIIAIYEASPPKDCELEEHKLLTDLVYTGRADDAVNLMESHLIGIENRLDLSVRGNIQGGLRASLSG